MRKFFILWSREVAMYFRSPVAYVILFFFLLLTGVNFYFTVKAMNEFPSRSSVVETYFTGILLFFVIPFPLITMRLFAEEYKLGTIEPLMTAPVRDIQVLLAKYFSAVFFYIVLWLPSLLYFAVFQWQTQISASTAVGPYLGAYTILLLIGLFYLSIGCLASALTRNQVVAAIISFVVISLLYYWGFYSVWFPNVSPLLRDLTDYLSALRHMGMYSQGQFDTRPVVLYLSMTTLVLFATYQAFQYRRWKV